MPVSVIALFSSAFSSIELRKQNDVYKSNQLVNQLVYTSQISLSRQFSTAFAVQLTGSYVHKNTVESVNFDNDRYGIGAGARVKLSDRIHFLAEYNYMFNNPDNFFNPAAVGIDVVAGGHVFNLHFSNSLGIIEKEYLTATRDKFGEGLRFGFTIRRSFLLKSKVSGGGVKY